MFSRDNEIPDAAWLGRTVADIARVSKGKMNAQDVMAIIGDDVNGRNRGEMRQAIIGMCTSFPKATT